MTLQPKRQSSVRPGQELGGRLAFFHSAWVSWAQLPLERQREPQLELLWARAWEPLLPLAQEARWDWLPGRPLGESRARPRPQQHSQAYPERLSERHWEIKWENTLTVINVIITPADMSGAKSSSRVMSAGN